MFAWLVLLLYRVQDPIGEVFYVEKIDPSNLPTFVKQKGVNIVVFSDDLSKCSYMNFAISKFVDYDFGVAPESAGGEYGCKDYPCVKPFRSGKEIEKISVAPRTAGTFTLWCETLANPTLVTIKNAEYLRVVLEMPGSCVFGVDISKRPPKLDKDQAFYYAPKKVFADLGVDVEKGIYVYRQADRQLVPVHGEDIMEMVQTNVTNLNFLQSHDRPFLAGFIMGSDTNESELEMSLMQTLANEFLSAFYIGIIPSTWVEQAGLQYVPGSKFVVFDNDEAKAKTSRYILRDGCHDIDNLRAFLKSIEAGTTKYTEIVETLPPQGYLNFTGLRELNTENDNFVIFADRKRNSLRALLILNKIQSLLNSPLMSIYMYNVSQNDLPEFKLRQVPGIVLINRNGAVQYPIDQFIFRDVFNFMLANVANRYNFPEVDHVEMDRNVSNEYFDKVKDLDEKDDTKYTIRKRYLNN